jgi:hypothetical protein
MMGFWHTGYMEFHETSGEGWARPAKPALSTYPCPRCGLVFSSEQDLHVHAFGGHAIRRPILVLMGRECGRSRLTVTTPTSPASWVTRNAQRAAVNGRRITPEEIAPLLSEQRSGVFDVELANAGVVQQFQFEFKLAEDDDLRGVDAALERLIEGHQLSLRAIDDFIMRGKRYQTASRYLAGLADYLYGVIRREDLDPAAPVNAIYEAKYDQAVGMLGAFDRPPAEAICGLVGFHYNQFDRAMTKTRSERVAAVSLRLQAMLAGKPWIPDDLSSAPHTSLDIALGDSVIDRVVQWCAIPLDGSATVRAADIVAALPEQRPHDALKLRLITAEHFLAARDPDAAIREAEELRHSQKTEHWYANFRSRVEGATGP